jgi:hypothetical protein
MYADPQSVTVATVAQSLPRIGMAIDAGKFRESDGSYELSVSHSSGRRSQHRVRLDSSKVVDDPYATDRNLPVSISGYVVLDAPLAGYSVAEQADHLIAIADWLKASTNALRLVGGES